jgi:Phosphotransferase system mannitol/fructose-specific IIA domain (Ntr-type)
MSITGILKKEFVIAKLKSKTRLEVLTELSKVFLKSDIRVNYDKIVEVLLEREKLGSTGIGDGIAIPHGKLTGLDDIIVSFGRSKDGIDFDSMDGRPVHLFFLLMAPENSAGHHLKALAKISRMLKDSSFRTELMLVKSADDLYRIIREKDKTC